MSSSLPSARYGVKAYCGWLGWWYVCVLHRASNCSLTVVNVWVPVHNALQYHQLMPTSCHFRDCKEKLLVSLTHVSYIWNAISIAFDKVRNTFADRKRAEKTKIWTQKELQRAYKYRKIWKKTSVYILQCKQRRHLRRLICRVMDRELLVWRQ